MAGKRVFISYDFDNDEALKNLVVGQSRLPDSPFEISDWSMKEAAPQRNWEDEARARIKRSNIVLVIVGQKTYQASGVLKEVKMAREEGVPIVQMIGGSAIDYTPVTGAGQLYRWNWENLKKLLS